MAHTAHATQQTQDIQQDTQQTPQEPIPEVTLRELWERRRLSPATIAALPITARSNALGFHYRNSRGALKFTKWRGPNKKFWIEPAGERLLLWNLGCCTHLNSTGGTLVITEGEFDAASVIEAGFPCAVSVPNGAQAAAQTGDIIPSQDSAYAYLWNGDRLIPELEAAQKIIIASDGDAPGRALAAELALRLGIERCFLAHYPPGTKDASDVLVKHGPEALHAMLQGASAIIPDKLVRWSELPAHEPPRGLASGWRDLDRHLLLTFPELVVVTGKPGSGKSRWALSWVLNLARLHGVRWTYVSLEDASNRMRRHTELYARTWSGASLMDDHTGELRTPIPKGGERDWLDAHANFQSPSVTEDDTRDLEWLKRIIWEAACRHDCKIIVLDPWNELEHMWDRRGMTVDEYITGALRDLKRLARRYGVTIVIIAHPDKNAGRNETVEEMSLYSISGGAAWKNKADGGIIVAQEQGTDGPTGNTIIKIDKRKDWDTMGTPGFVVLGFDVLRGIYVSK